MPRTARRLLLPVAMAALLGRPPTPAADVGFVEDFVLAPDRAAALRQLTPGTEDYYYYHALHALNTEQFERVGELTRPWLARFGRTARLVEIETRLALLTYDKTPDRSLAHVRDRLGLRFDHRPERPGAAPDLPTTLDPARVGRPALLADAFRRAGDALEPFEDAGLDHLTPADLTPARRRALLRRITRPDVPDLAKLVADDLAAPQPPAFGGLPDPRPDDRRPARRPHRPPARGSSTSRRIVSAYAGKLRPGADADGRRDRAVPLGPTWTAWRRFADRLVPGPQLVQGPRPLPPAPASTGPTGSTTRPGSSAYLALPRRQPYMAAGAARSSGRRPAAPGRPAGPASRPALRSPRSGPTSRWSATSSGCSWPTPRRPSRVRPVPERRVPPAPCSPRSKSRQGLGEPGRLGGPAPAGRVFRRFRDRVDIDFAADQQGRLRGRRAGPARTVYAKNVPEPRGQGVRGERPELATKRAAAGGGHGHQRWTA